MSDDYATYRVSGLTIRVDRRTCIGSGSCASVAPEVFEVGSDLVVTVRPDAPEVERQRLIEACEVCPVEALAAFDEKGESVLD